MSTKLEALEGQRVVSLVMESCCGCGCDDVTVERVVDEDSPLVNGSRIVTNDLLRGDVVDGDVWYD